MKRLKKTITKTVTLLLLVTFSFGCKAPMIKPQVRRLWSVTFNKCYCQTYDLTAITNTDNFKLCEDYFLNEFILKKKYIKKCSKKKYRSKNPEYCEQYDNPKYCDDLVGFNAQVWSKKITPWGKEIKRYGEDSCK